VLDAIGRLSVRQRAVVYLTYWDDLEPADAAERLGISEGSVRRHLARARANLRRTLRDA
jgi:RNA polymerase sigma-70 factor (ECF subfamily)